MIEFKYDTQLLIEGNGLDKKEVTRYFDKKLKGDCLIVAQTGNSMKIHFPQNEHWYFL